MNRAVPDAIVIFRFHSVNVLAQLRRIVGRHFPLPASHYAAMDAQSYRTLVAAAQDEMNERRMVHRLVGDLRPEIEELMQTECVLVQSNLYLRAARPIGEGQQESVGWHRESFYGCPAQAVNFWVPVQGVTPDSAIRYVPGSETIPDDTIVTVREDDLSVMQKSDGHKIGLLYAPKRIVSGVELSKAQPMNVAEGEVAVFPGSLIHGAAVNRTAQIRFSVDVRLLAREHLDVGQQKQHFASGREYFVPLEAA